ncbi:hypothetical protein V2H45_05260 [Tumidithrix elongata RA019]|uniref:Uncharacterized protein n=1 Tax=Tumidithrix elongata BACA0141 TaxID=2716417 RepID=A0AAW9Q0M2_9CYAN|nr:hypothetical protein [Tumidithrix elongata RA019]
MKIQIKGTIQFHEFGMGAWAVVAESGEQYELMQPAPSQLLQAGLSVKITGVLREDIMTMAMIGAVLQVESFEVVT